MIHVFDLDWGGGWGVVIDTFRYKPIKLERIYRALNIGKQSGRTVI